MLEREHKAGWTGQDGWSEGSLDTGGRVSTKGPQPFHYVTCNSLHLLPPSITAEWSLLSEANFFLPLANAIVSVFLCLKWKQAHLTCMIFERLKEAAHTHILTLYPRVNVPSAFVVLNLSWRSSICSQAWRIWKGQCSAPAVPHQWDVKVSTEAKASPTCHSQSQPMRYVRREWEKLAFTPSSVQTTEMPSASN